jgi:hypothetical protein
MYEQLSSPTNVAAKPAPRKRWLTAFAALFVALTVAVLAGCSTSDTGSSSSGDTITVPPSNAWAAVFLGDNEVFFGHVKNVNGTQLELTTVYYLQKTTSPAGQNNTTTASQLSLAGLVGNQIQCPTDDLVINRNAVLYYQELQNESYVVQKLGDLIKGDKQKCVQPSAASASPTPAAN